MIGREKELDLLEKLYSSAHFEFLCLYGRRRVGKSTLLYEFASRHPCIFVTGQEKNNSLNQSDFVKAILNFYKLSFVIELNEWKHIFEFLNEQIRTHSQEEKIVIIIDEFPFIAKEDPSIKSALQTIIDQVWKKCKILLILCGSSVSFMLNEVLGEKSPLHGRATSEYELLPFDYIITKDFFPKMSNLDRIISYGILGGIPLYLLSFDDNNSLNENIEKLLSPISIMRHEPMNLLRCELREPLFYNSILLSISEGATKNNEIALKVKEENTKTSKYLDVLQTLRIVQKTIPYGESTASKKGLYQIKDFYFKFWYRYIFPNEGKIELLGKRKIVENILSNISDYMGLVFEEICTQYMIQQAKNGNLPFVPNGFGKWWGNNPIKKQQDDVDIIGLEGEKGIFCECKFRNEVFDLSEFEDLIDASKLFSHVKERFYYIFVKSGYTDAVQKEAQKYKTKLLTIDDLFE